MDLRACKAYYYKPYKASHFSHLGPGIKELEYTTPQLSKTTSTMQHCNFPYLQKELAADSEGKVIISPFLL